MFPVIDIETAKPNCLRRSRKSIAPSFINHSKRTHERIPPVVTDRLKYFTDSTLSRPETWLIIIAAIVIESERAVHGRWSLHYSRSVAMKAMKKSKHNEERQISLSNVDAVNIVDTKQYSIQLVIGTYIRICFGKATKYVCYACHRNL